MPDNTFDNLQNNDDVQKAQQAGKSILRDRIIPHIKNGLLTEGVTAAGLAAGTALGVKKGLAGRAYKSLGGEAKKELLTKAITNQGLKGMAIGSIGGNAAVPAARLTALHRKEFGTNPDLKDYATVEATHALPTAAYWGLALKNRGALEKGLTGAASSISKYQQTKKLGDLKGVAHAAEGGGALAVADKAADAMEFLGTPESIISKKKKKLEQQNGDGNTVGGEKSAYVVIDEAFEKQAEILEMYSMDKEASSFGEILRGDNVKRVERMMGKGSVGGGNPIEGAIGAVNKVREKAEIASRVPGFIDRTIQPGMHDTYEMAKNNKHTKVNSDGTISILDSTSRRDTKGLSDDQLNQHIRDKRKAKNQAENEYNQAKQNFDDHVKSNYSKQEDGTGTRLDDFLHKRRYDKNVKDNQGIQSYVDKIKNGEDLSRDEKFRLTRTNRDLGKDVRTGALDDHVQKLKDAKAKFDQAHGDLKTYADEKELRGHVGKIENYNTFKNVTNKVSGETGSVNKVLGDFNKTFTINGQEPKDELKRMHAKESAKTMAARGAVGLGAVGAGIGAEKVLHSGTQSDNGNSGQSVNPYKAQDSFKPRNDFGSNNNFKPRNNFNNSGTSNNATKLAQQIIDEALMNK